MVNEVTFERHDLYEMITKPILYDSKTEEIDKPIKKWQIVMKEAKKYADFNNLANEYFGE